MFSSNVFLAQESKESYHKRMQWWDEGRLGMFLHWGVYSTFGCEYNGTDYGKEIGQTSAEWIYLSSNMPEKEYQNAALNWNPNKYNAEEWVKMAKNAGIKYMVLTSKHHDGYALFNSEASEWNSVKSSAVKKDLIKEFVLACNKYDMKVGFYYSHEKDWVNHARQNVDPNPISKDYENFVRKQVTELCTNYGKIDLIWFDTPVHKHSDFNKMCADIVRKLQPECIISGRIGSGLGDYKNIGDRAIVNPGMAGYMESIMTMRLNWGYDKNDDYWKPSDELIKMVSKSACRGSNFLLNIGPTPEGVFPLQDQVRIEKLGEWMRLNSEAIYKTKGSPFLKEHIWGSLSQSKEENVIYLHLWNWTGGDITVKGLLSQVKSASFLDTADELEFIKHEKSAELTIKLPELNTSKSQRIIKLIVDKKVFDTTKGPDFVAPVVKHKEHLKLTGKITKIDGINFTITGNPVARNRKGVEIHKDIITNKFTLNDNVRFRINTNGDIRSVQNINLSEGANYHIVYSPVKDKPEVKIITLLN